MSTPTPVERGIRTAIAAGVGIAVAEVARVGLKIPAADQTQAVVYIVAVTTTAYNAVALWAEQRFGWARWLMLNIGATKRSIGPVAVTPPATPPKA